MLVFTKKEYDNSNFLINAQADFIRDTGNNRLPELNRSLEHSETLL